MEIIKAFGAILGMSFVMMNLLDIDGGVTNTQLLGTVLVWGYIYSRE